MMLWLWWSFGCISCLILPWSLFPFFLETQLENYVYMYWKQNASLNSDSNFNTSNLSTDKIIYYPLPQFPTSFSPLKNRTKDFINASLCIKNLLSLRQWMIQFGSQGTSLINRTYRIYIFPGELLNTFPTTFQWKLTCKRKDKT